MIDNFKMMKVFDCQWNPGMPQDVKRALFDYCEAGNDTYVSWDVGDQLDGYADKEDDDTIEPNRKKVDDWLIENGAVIGEEVLIKHWW